MKRRIFTIISVVLTVACAWALMPGTTAAVQPRTLMVSQTPGAADFTTIQAAITAASAGDTVEIIDSAVYQESPIIRADKMGLTLRAREGQTPTIMGTQSAVIRVFSAQNITLSGLTMTGGTNDGLVAIGQPVRNLTVQNCRFEAIPDTGIVLDNEDGAVIEGCRFENLGGPGLVLSGGASAEITGNEFLGGELNGEFSDGIELEAASADIIGNQFMNVGRVGIGTFFQDENATTRTSTIQIINNLIVGSGSTIPEGGDGMQIVGSANTINQFTIVNNTVVNSARFGIGFGFGDAQSRAVLANTIVTGSGGSSDLAIYSGFSSRLTATQTTIRHCLIGQDTRFNSIGRNGNITGDPQFVNPVNDNYRLQPGSPAIDTGDNSALSGFMTDLDGNPRVVDGDGDGTATIDIGAYEAVAVAQPMLKADYQFQNTLTSSVSEAPALINLGNNTFATATVDGTQRTVLNFAQNNGLALSPTAGLIPNDAYTVVILFAFRDVNGYRRILDFKNGTSDNGLYVFSGQLTFFPVVFGPGAPIAANAYVQVVLTRNAGGNVAGYVNGVQQFSFADSGGLAVIDANNTLRFFQDNTSGGAGNEASAGSVARIRLYDGALSASAVAALDRLPTGG